MQIRTVAACLLAAVVCAVPAEAQQATASASVSGTVLDPTDARVVKAAVRLVNRGTNRTTEATSDDRGRFRFFAIPVGQYRLSAVAKGFGTTEVDLTLMVGQQLDIPLRLAVAASESISVSAETPLVDTARTHIAEAITPEEIDTLPLNGRNYLDLALLAPNVSRTTTRSNERFAETSAVPGTGISVAGQRNLTNTFIVDGLSANDDAADLAGTSFAEEVIREFQVITTGGGAEFGRYVGLELSAWYLPAIPAGVRRTVVTPVESERWCAGGPKPAQLRRDGGPGARLPVLVRDRCPLYGSGGQRSER
jgi:hypothetical protein